MFAIMSYKCLNSMHGYPGSNIFSPDLMVKVLLIIFLFSCFVLILASSRIDRPRNSNRERSMTESSFTRYPKTAPIIIDNGVVARNDATMSSSFSVRDNRKMSFSPGEKYRVVSPIADPNFYEHYWGKKHPDEDKCSATPEGINGNESSSDEKHESTEKDKEIDGQDDELFFEMDMEDLNI